MSLTWHSNAMNVAKGTMRLSCLSVIFVSTRYAILIVVDWRRFQIQTGLARVVSLTRRLTRVSKSKARSFAN